MIQDALGLFILNQPHATKALATIGYAHQHGEGPRPLAGLLLGPPSSRLLAARALAWSIDAPFVSHEGKVHDKTWLALLEAAGFDAQAAQRGIIYIDLDRVESQQEVLDFISGEDVPSLDKLSLQRSGMLYLLGHSGMDSPNLIAELALMVRATASLVPLTQAALVRIIACMEMARWQGRFKP
jgi:hypothetical protein